MNKFYVVYQEGYDEKYSIIEFLETEIDKMEEFIKTLKSEKEESDIIGGILYKVINGKELEVKLETIKKVKINYNLTNDTEEKVEWKNL